MKQLTSSCVSRVLTALYSTLTSSSTSAMPILILMARPSKRNYFTVTFMAMIIIFGHWLDYYQMIMPGAVGARLAHQLV